MRLVSLKVDGLEQAGITIPSGYVLVNTVNQVENTSWSTSIYELIMTEQLDALIAWVNGAGQEKLPTMEVIPMAVAQMAPIYRHPRKIWGIGMNYVKDPAELADLPVDDEPVSFMKPDTTLIGEGDAIVLPPQSTKVTTEAELAIVIGKTCKNISEEEAVNFVAGFVATLDTTAADIHAKNQRFLTRAKSFDTFFTLGSELITTDEVGNVLDLQVETWLNGEMQHKNVISNMRFQPWYAVAFHSQVMTLLPGDIILTGTPGAVVIRGGDVVECRISGFTPLLSKVVG